MKVNPRNQTLILASERRRQSDTSSATLDNAVSAASSGGVLKRVTVVVSQPDTSVVYLHADYAPTVEAKTTAGGDSTEIVATSSGASVTPGTALISRVPSQSLVAGNAGAPRDVHGNLWTSTREVTLSSYLRPTEQYAQTQRILGSTGSGPLVDVHA